MKYLHMKSMPSKKIHEDMKNSLGVKKWNLELKRGRTINEDEPRSSRLKDTTTDLRIDVLHSMVINVR